MRLAVGSEIFGIVTILEQTEEAPKSEPFLLRDSKVFGVLRKPRFLNLQQFFRDQLEIFPKLEYRRELVKLLPCKKNKLGVAVGVSVVDVVAFYWTFVI